METTYEKRLQRQLDESFLFTPFLGVNVTIHDERLGCWDAACGHDNPQTKQPLSPKACFYTYSITKTFVATIILKLGTFNQQLSDFEEWLCNSIWVGVRRRQFSSCV